MPSYMETWRKMSSLMDLPLGCNVAHDKKNQENNRNYKRMLGCKPTDTLIEMNQKLCEDMDWVPTNKEQYQYLVGRNAVDRILRYLKAAPGNGLMFSKNGNLGVVGYTDADSAGSITSRCSTSGYFIFVGGNLVTWRSNRSNAEAEYR
ncbi:unnamed protein product [Prunus armeniaca]